MAQLQRFGSVNNGRRRRLTPSSKNVDDDIGGMDALGQALSAGGFNGGQAVTKPGGKNFDHLPVAVVTASELAPYALQIGRQHPILEWRSIPQSPRLAGEDRHVMPGIVDCLAAAERATMVAHDPPVLADHNAVSISVTFDRPADGTRCHRVFVVIEAHQAGLRDGGWDGVESVEAAGIGNKLGPFRLSQIAWPVSSG
jgi:hypothetical protein